MENNKNNLTAIPFDRNDWDGFCGSESWDNENPPLTISPITNTGNTKLNWFAVCDKNGIELHTYDERGENEKVYSCNRAFKTQKQAIKALSAISDTCTAKQFALIFKMKKY